MTLLAQTFLEGKNSAYLVLGVAGMVIIYVVIRPFMKRKNDPFKTPPQRHSLSQQRSVERQMESLLVELSNMARQMTAQLDTRSAKLELLIREADEKLAELRDAKKQIEHLPKQVLRREPEPMPEPEPEPDLPKEKLMDSPRELLTGSSPELRAFAAKQVPRDPTPPPRKVERLIPPPSEVDPRHAPIYDLASTGKSAAEIAHTLNRPIGEVELILALRPR